MLMVFESLYMATNHQVFFSKSGRLTIIYRLMATIQRLLSTNHPVTGLVTHFNSATQNPCVVFLVFQSIGAHADSLTWKPLSEGLFQPSFGLSFHFNVYKLKQSSYTDVLQIKYCLPLIPSSLKLWLRVVIHMTTCPYLLLFSLDYQDLFVQFVI